MSMDLYVYDISYFSGKMQAYLRYKGLEHRTHHASWMQLAHELVEETGVMEVPLLRLADGRLMRDTTRMIETLEAEHPVAPLLPTDPALAFVMRVLEDYADEGLWRPALYYRWAYSKDAALYARRFHEDFLDLPGLRTPGLRGPLRALQRHHLIWRQKVHYLAGEGVTRHNSAAVEQHYLDELHDLNALLAHRPYLLGERPSLVDFGYFASMFRHFSLDPTPGRLMRDRAPRVYAWVANLWAAQASTLADSPLRTWPEVADDAVIHSILGRVGRIYLPYLHANARAVHDSVTRFDAVIDGHTWPRLFAVPFRAWGRHRLIGHYRALQTSDRARVDALLGPTGCLEPLLFEPSLDHRYPQGDQLPFCGPRTPLSTWTKWKLTFTGTPHHKSTR